MDVIEAARAIRPFLSELLLDDEAAQGVDEALGRLLGRGANDRRDEIAALLVRHPATRNWAAAFLEHGRPPGLDLAVERSASYAALPGLALVGTAPRFACPEDDYVWWQRAVGLAPPRCPTHDLELVARDA